MTYGHLQADCCTLGSTPGPTLGIEYGKASTSTSTPWVRPCATHCSRGLVLLKCNEMRQYEVETSAFCVKMVIIIYLYLVRANLFANAVETRPIYERVLLALTGVARLQAGLGSKTLQGSQSTLRSRRKDLAAGHRPI